MLFSRRGPLFGVEGRRSSALSTQVDWADLEFQASFWSPFLRLATALVVLAAPVQLGAAPETTVARQVRALVEAKIAHDGPGVAVLVSRNGAPIHQAGYGLADVKAETPITPDSLFDLASVSKHITGVAILTLVEQGKLELDKPVSDYLEDFKVPVKGRAVTVNDLLHHVSGLADYTSDDWDGTDEEFASLTNEAHLKWLNTTKPRRAPGVKYEYNNSEYALLASIVEGISGQSFARYAHEHLFVPAGMTHTFILDGTSRLPSEAVKGYATNSKGKVKRSSSPTVITGDGSVYTSVRELALWDKAVRTNRIISRRSQELAWSNGHYDNGNPIRDGDGDGYGFGWVIEKQSRVVSHSGSWNGTATYFLLDLRNGLTVAVLSNDEKTDVSDLAEQILKLFASDL
jgi:CubicO group peptidase (beta-lactamase class C family)